MAKASTGNPRAVWQVLKLASGIEVGTKWPNRKQKLLMSSHMATQQTKLHCKEAQGAGNMIH